MLLTWCTNKMLLKEPLVTVSLQVSKLQGILKGDVEAYLADRHVADVLADFPAAHLPLTEVPQLHGFWRHYHFNEAGTMLLLVNWELQTRPRVHAVLWLWDSIKSSMFLHPDTLVEAFTIAARQFSSDAL
jgi:hypothetical protein